MLESAWHKQNSQWGTWAPHNNFKQSWNKWTVASVLITDGNSKTLCNICWKVKYFTTRKICPGSCGVQSQMDDQSFCVKDIGRFNSLWNPGDEDPCPQRTNLIHWAWCHSSEVWPALCCQTSFLSIPKIQQVEILVLRLDTTKFQILWSSIMNLQKTSQLSSICTYHSDYQWLQKSHTRENLLKCDTTMRVMNL